MSFIFLWFLNNQTHKANTDSVYFNQLRLRLITARWSYKTIKSTVSWVKRHRIERESNEEKEKNSQQNESKTQNSVSVSVSVSVSDSDKFENTKTIRNSETFLFPWNSVQTVSKPEFKLVFSTQTLTHYNSLIVQNNKKHSELS